MSQIGGSVLNPYHVGDFLKHAGHGGRLDGKGRAAGHVVDDQRQIHGFGNGLHVGEDPFLGGLVVIGGDMKGRVCSGLLGIAGQADDLGRIVGAGPGDDRYSAFGLLNADADNLFMFFMGQRC